MKCVANMGKFDVAGSVRTLKLVGLTVDGQLNGPSNGLVLVLVRPVTRCCRDVVVARLCSLDTLPHLSCLAIHIFGLAFQHRYFDATMERMGMEITMK